MPRGGIHKGTLKPNWNAGKTTTIRVPIALKEKILRTTKALDALESEGLIIERDSYEKALTLLKESLTLKANAGGKIKENIRAALALLDD